MDTSDFDIYFENPLKKNVYKLLPDRYEESGYYIPSSE